MREIYDLPIEAIRPDPANPRKRFNEEALRRLGTSIRREGLLQPIAVRPDGIGGYLLIAGERRYRASRLEGLPTIRAEIHESITEQKARALALLENFARADLNPMEEAEGIAALKRHGYTIEQVAEAVGLAVSTLENTLKLLNLCPEVQDLVRKGHVSKALGQRMSKLSANGQLEVCQTIGIEDAKGESAKAVIDAQIMLEAQRDIFAEVLEDTNGNRVNAIERRFLAFYTEARRFLRTIERPKDLMLIPAALQNDLGRKVDFLDVLIKSLARVQREMLAYRQQRRAA